MSVTVRDSPRLACALQAGEDLEEFAGMKEVVKFLLSKFPTGDYMGKYPEEELPPDSEVRVPPGAIIPWAA